VSGEPATANLSSAVAALLAPLVVDPTVTALVTDFDGTLSPIVDDPAAARPLGGVPELLRQLADRFAVVAVVSGRPASFLVEHLGHATGNVTGEVSGVRFIGLYGMEEAALDGTVRLADAAASWLPVVADAAVRLRAEAPEEVLVEVKGAAVTAHWRRTPGAEAVVLERVAAEATRTGLVPHLGRSSVELRPPVGIDKGTVVGELTHGCRAACFLGDDLGDLPAYAALARRSATDGTAVVGVAVRDAETAPEVLAAADLVVDGPEGAVAVLAWLATHSGGEAPGSGGSDA
jgi:trehalose 6-phosphate phosphatase